LCWDSPPVAKKALILFLCRIPAMPLDSSFRIYVCSQGIQATPWNCALIHGASQCSLDLMQWGASKTRSCRFVSLPCQIPGNTPRILWRHLEEINECMGRNSICQGSVAEFFKSTP
jgi:hypothetical protein